MVVLLVGFTIVGVDFFLGGTVEGRVHIHASGFVWI